MDQLLQQENRDTKMKNNKRSQQVQPHQQELVIEVIQARGIWTLGCERNSKSTHTCAECSIPAERQREHGEQKAKDDDGKVAAGETPLRGTSADGARSCGLVGRGRAEKGTRKGFFFFTFFGLASARTSDVRGIGWWNWNIGIKILQHLTVKLKH